MATLLLALTVAQPVSWTGSPEWRADAADAPHLRTVFHKIEINLNQTTATYKAKTLYKNTGTTDLTGQILVPIIGRDGDDEWFKTDVRGTWGDKAVASHGLVSNPGSDVAGARWYGFKVSLKPGEWKAFESALSRPLNKSGEGWAERFVTYLMRPCEDKLEQFQLSVKYPKNLVFQTATVSPSIGWQVGEKGAFYSKKDWLPGKTAFRFQFYPGTFERIGR